MWGRHPSTFLSSGAQSSRRKTESVRRPRYINSLGYPAAMTARQFIMNNQKPVAGIGRNSTSRAKLQRNEFTFSFSQTGSFK